MKKLENSREGIQSAHSCSQEECLFSQQTPLLQLFGFSWHADELESLFAVLFYSLPTLMSNKVGRVRRHFQYFSTTLEEENH